jgi:membrane-associated phospholipid phosphatase
MNPHGCLSPDYTRGRARDRGSGKDPRSRSRTSALGPSSVGRSRVPAPAGRPHTAASQTTASPERAPDVELGASSGWRRALLLPQRPLIEVAGVLALYLVYELSRGFVIGEVHAAYRHAQDVVSLESRLHIFGEGAIQQRFAVVPGLLSSLSFFYVSAHLTVTVAILIWLYRRRPELYARARNTLALASFAALAGYWLFPTMPPRLAAAGVTDSVSRHTPVNLGSTLLGRFYNPYAAVPSMHFGYALVLGALLAYYGRRLSVRIVGAAYPILVLLAIVSTGNHYFFDAFAGAIAVALAWFVVGLATRFAAARDRKAAAVHWQQRRSAELVAQASSTDGRRAA